MAEEYVSKEQFGEFVKRIEAGFAHVNEFADQRYDSINQRLADAEKAREQNLIHINQRFDNMNRGMNQRFDDLKDGIGDIRADMRQMRNWLVWLFGLVVFGFIGSIVLILFRDVFK